jgi:hypothetical protein
MNAILDPEQREALRKLGIEGRLRVAASLWEHARALKEATLRALHPDWTDETVRSASREALRRGRR